ncbi:MAG: IclR family transcriptional regulator [Thermoleophilia bacterium]|nr:IclR family transcriptional regulator [Thermoleophilia bacterium]
MTDRQDKNTARKMEPVQALVRGIQILRQFSANSTELSVSQLSERTGLHRTTVYRVARTLESEGLLVFDPTTKLYSLGPGWAALVLTAGTGFGLVKILEPELQALAEATQESVAMGVRHGRRVYIVRAITSASIYSLRSSQRGVHSLTDTWHAGVKLHLAWSDREIVEDVLNSPIVKYTEHTITDRKTLEEVLLRARKERIAYELEERNLGVCAVSVPVLLDDTLIATFGLVALKERFDKNREQYEAMLRQTASKMVERLAREGLRRKA